MFRYAIEDLKKWATQNRPKPLVIRGARQVGKSTLVRIFCKTHGLDLLEINLEKTKLREINNETSFSISKVINEIELTSQQKITVNTILFLDEIQEQPLALNRLRYFYEDRPDLRVIAAGSLLDVMIDDANFSMPVGRINYYFLGPMTFSEFLIAKKEDILLEQLSKLTITSSLPQALHERSIDLLKEYYFVGGMPEAISQFIDTNDMKRVRDVQASLLQTYRDDIPKYTKAKQGIRVKEVFEYVPAHLGECKVKYNEISETHSSLVKDAITILDKAQVIIKTVNNSVSGIPLSAGADTSTIKLFFLDVGLYNAAAELQWTEIIKLNDKELLTKGSIAEQFAAQHLKYRSNNSREELYYWLRGGKKEAAEVDFIISHEGTILPIEIKAGSTGKMRSLWQLLAEKELKVALKLDLKYRDQFVTNISQKVVTSSGNKDVECTLYTLPLYMIEFISRLVNRTSL